MQKAKVSGDRTKTKSIDIFLPEREGTLRITFLKPPFKNDRKVRLQFCGIDRRFRHSRKISSPRIGDIVKAAAQLY